MRERIVRNQIQCLTCDMILLSRHRYDYVACGCGPAADGGTDYLRRTWSFDRYYIECSVVEGADGMLLQTWGLCDVDGFVELLPSFTVDEAWPSFLNARLRTQIKEV